MRNLPKLVMFILLIALSISQPVNAHPTGAPLLSFPVDPCRILDTRSTNNPIETNFALDVYVRGDSIDNDGSSVSDCGVPPKAEAVLINVTAIDPTSAGYIQVNGTGGITLASPYSRIVFLSGQLISNEMQVTLCNVTVYPVPHVPCSSNLQDKYSDFQIEPYMALGGNVHVVVDVIGYLSRD